MSDVAVTGAQRKVTGAAKRASARLAILDAAVDCLIEEGYANLSTRRVAERAGVAQSTQMHHFPTREQFLVEALGRVAQRMATELLDSIPLADLHLPERRSAVLDSAWAAFTSPVAQAATELWVAAYNEPELAAALLELEGDLLTIITGAASTVMPDLAADGRFAVLLDAAVALMRGLALSLPVAGRDITDARWQAIKPLLLQIAHDILDD